MKKNTFKKHRTDWGLALISLSSFLALGSSASAQQDVTVFDDQPNSPGDLSAPRFGFDFTKAEFRYAPDTDVLDVRLKFNGIAGDSNGDGNSPNFGIGEEIMIEFDLNFDNVVDYSTGIPSSESLPEDNNIPLPSSSPSITGVSAVLVDAPSSANPDFHIRITGWSQVGSPPETFTYTASVSSDSPNTTPDTIEGQVNLSFLGRAQFISEDENLIPDVGVIAPPGAPAGTISGWDIRQTEFRYNPVADTMMVTLDFFGIAGDADGDGDPGAFTALTGGSDFPNLGGSETIAVAFDFDGDAAFDIVAGISTSSAIDPMTLEADVAVFANINANIGGNFGASTNTDATATLEHNPSATDGEQDFVMVIDHWSELTDNPFQFAFASFAGSIDDSGFGEDNHLGDIALETRLTGRMGSFDDFALPNGELSPDVGIPPGTSNLSGWDFRTLDFVYSPVTDTLVIDIDFFGIAGDADGDGDPGVFSSSVGGSDPPNLGTGETITIAFVLNNNGTEQVVVGIPRDESLNPDNLELVIAEILPNELMGVNYGTTIEGGASAFAAANPSSSNPDFKVIIRGWSLLDIDDPSDFSFRVFCGSFVDAGFGEDNIPNPGSPPELAVLVPEIIIETFIMDPYTGEASMTYSGGLEEGPNMVMSLGSDLSASGQSATVIRVEEGTMMGDGTVNSNFFGTTQLTLETEAEVTREFFRVASGVQ